MPRPRKPTAILEANGAFKKDPNRRREKEPMSKKGVGEPPKYFDSERVEIWNEIKSSIVEGVAVSSDRISLEMLCNTIYEYRQNPSEFLAADKSQMRSLLNSFGMSPSSRAGIEIPKKANTENPFYKILNP